MAWRDSKHNVWGERAICLLNEHVVHVTDAPQCRVDIEENLRLKVTRTAPLPLQTDGKPSHRKQSFAYIRRGQYNPQVCTAGLCRDRLILPRFKSCVAKHKLSEQSAFPSGQGPKDEDAATTCNWQCWACDPSRFALCKWRFWKQSFRSNARGIQVAIELMNVFL